MQYWLLVIGLIFAGGILGRPDFPAHAHDGATGVVKERMDAMTAMGAAMKTLAQMMRNKTPYDPARVKAAARTIASHGGRSLLVLFPHESLQAPTLARPEIWTGWREFSDLAMGLTATAGALATAADGPRTVSKSAFTRLSRVCSGCHDAYRLKR